MDIEQVDRDLSLVLCARCGYYIYWHPLPRGDQEDIREALTAPGWLAMTNETGSCAHQPAWEAAA
jgi:hypothetical protein